MAHPFPHRPFERTARQRHDEVETFLNRLATAVTAGQLRETVERLRRAGHWRPGDPTIWIVLDSGYDVCRLAFLLADLPVVLIGRLRSDRVLARPVGRPTGRGRPRRLSRPYP